MGCDIHMFSEKYSSDDYEGPKDVSEERNSKLNSILEDITIHPRWITTDKWIYNHNVSDDPDDGYWEIDRNSRIYSGRNYSLFNTLANVRGNGPSISKPRGVPGDASYAYRNELEMWGGDAHSESYYTLRELLDVDWDLYRRNDQYDHLDEFMETIEKMKKIDPDPEKVRCVFFFDN